MHRQRHQRTENKAEEAEQSVLLAQVFFFFDYLILLPKEFPMSISRKSTSKLKLLLSVTLAVQKEKRLRSELLQLQLMGLRRKRPGLHTIK
jgi:hypothetical protein